jgi:WhiB family transcriptional regulator, redox-sensing transcriptional regulator
MLHRDHETATQYDNDYLTPRGSAASWYDRAACAKADPEMFFPLGKVAPSDPRVTAAKGVCWRCDVRAECFSWVLDHPQEEGIWAGLDPVERRSITRRQRRLRTAEASSQVRRPGAETAC